MTTHAPQACCVSGDMEKALLLREIVNNLFYSQYEQFRAFLHLLCDKDPGFALSLLYSILHKGGRVQGVLWSESIPSASHLAWLCLRDYDTLQNKLERASSTKFVSMTRACELLLYVEELGRCLEEEMPLSETNDKSLSASGQEDRASTAWSGPSVDAAFREQAIGSGCQVLEQVSTAIIHLIRHLGAHEHFQGESEPVCVNLELNNCDPQGRGARTMHGSGAIHGHVESAQDSRQEAGGGFVDSPENILEKLTLAVPELFAAFCKASAEWVLLPSETVSSACTGESLRTQYASMVDHEGLCNATRSAFSLTTDEDMLCLHSLVRIKVPRAHLRAMRKNLQAKFMVKAAQHLRYLNESVLVADSAYRDVIKVLLVEAFKEACGDHFWPTAGKLKSLRVVLCSEVLASGGTSICLLLESMQDNILREEATRSTQASKDLLFALLACMHNHLRNIHAWEVSTETKTQAKDNVFVDTKCDIFQYAYVHGAQAISEVVYATLLLLDGLQFHVAADVLAPFPHLQAIIVVMGWDLLFTKTSALQKMVQILWACRPELTRIDKEADGVAAVEYLCEELRFRLEVAYFVSDLSVGWASKRRGSIFGCRVDSGPCEDIETGDPADPFVANLVLEHLQMQSPMRVIFQFLPDIYPQDALFLLGKQPTEFPAVSRMGREGDLELVHMYFGIMAAIRVLRILKRDVSLNPKPAEAKENNGYVLSDVQEHLELVSTPARWLWMLNAVVSIFYLGLEVVESKHTAQELPADQPAVRKCLVARDGGMNAGSLMDVSVMIEFLTIVKTILSAKRGLARIQCDMEEKGSSTSWAGRASQVEMIVDDWSWRMEGMQRLSGQQLPWTDILIASPSTFLNICLQKRRFDLGRDTLDRFDLPTHEVASLLLAEWIDRVEASVVGYDDGISIPNDALDLIHDATLSALSNAILCLDFCIAYSGSIQTSLPLFNEASKKLAVNEGMHFLPETADITCVSKHLVDHIREVFSQDHFRSMQTEFVRPEIGADPRQGPRLRALLLLQQVIGDASSGKRQFLSGKLHNIVKALADDEADDIGARLESVDSKHWQFEAGVALGLGFAVMASLGTGAGVNQPFGEIVPYPLTKGGRRWLSSLGSKPMAFLSAFTLYIATIGDVVDGVDTTHDFNFFSLICQSPKDLLTRLSFEEISFDAAVKVAEIMGVDLVQHVISVSAHCVHPPYAAKGWATIHEALYVESSVSSNIGGLAKETGYNLWLDGIKHLMTISPPRATLVCVFGNSRCSAWSEDCAQTQQDRDRALFEFTLEQSENFPILNRWIQMQVNLQRLSRFPNNRSCKTYDKVVAGQKTLKRLHSRLDEPQEWEEDDQSLCRPQEGVVKNLGNKKEVTQHELEVTSVFQGQMVEPSEANQAQERGQLNLKTAGYCRVSELAFDWESRGPYEDAVWRLVGEGKLMDALALADRWLCDGAPDQLLELLVEKGQGSAEQSTQWHAQGAHLNSWNNSWQYCIRLRDKNLAAELALRYLDGWELAAAIDVLTMCKCQLLPNEPQYQKVSERRDALLQFSRIMQADAEFVKWQEVELLSRIDPEGLALRLSGKGAVLEALEIAESFRLPSPLRTELQGRHLVKIFQTGPVEGGGPASGLKFLLQHSENAFPIAMAALEQLPDLQSKQLLVQFISKNHAGMLSEDDHLKVDQMVLSLRMLGALPLPWQNRCSALHAHPKLIFETLLMWKQWRTALELLQTFPSLRDDTLVISYAAKAIYVSIPVIAEPSPAPIQASGKLAHSAVSESHLKSIPGNWHGDGRSASATLMAEHDGISKHKNSSAVPPRERAAWAPMPGLVDEHLAGLVPEGYGRVASVALAEDWVLTGDPGRDECVRSLHRFENAPCAILFKSLLSLCSQEEVAIRAAVDLCVAQAERLLGAEHLTPAASLESIERAFSAAGVFILILQGAEQQIQALLADEKDDMAELLDSAHQWLRRMAVLQSLLGARVSASLDDIGHVDSSMQLRDRLLAEERYSLALSICAKWKVNAFPAWNAWGHALLSIGRYSQAREKFQQAMQCLTSDPTSIVRQIVFAIEAGPPADVSAVNDLYIHMANNVYSSSDDSLSADSYLNVLHVPSFQKTEKARWSVEDSPDSSGHLLSTMADDHVLQSNLDDAHFEECMLYLKAFCQQDVLSFAFQHGRYTQACQIMLPTNGMQSPALLSLHQMQAPSPSPQRLDSLATEYGSVDDLCEFCVGYSTIPVLEHTLAAVASNQVPDAHVLIAASLLRICNYCEVHRHFNHLYRFQLLKKDHVAAGLCQIQLFQFSLMQEEAVQHLEQAKVHFDEGLLARQAGEGVKNVAKVNRVRSPAEKLTEEELIKFSARVGLQVDVTRSLCDTEGCPWMYSLFGNPNDADTLKRRCEVVEILLDRTFDLAFKIIYEFTLPRIHIYAGFAASLAAKKKSHHLTEFFHNIRGTIGDEDLDQILGAAISVYADRHRERPDQLIEMISSSHRKVLALVICGRLKAAFQVASKTGSVSDVQYVAHQAQYVRASAVVELCKNWLRQVAMFP